MYIKLRVFALLCTVYFAIHLSARAEEPHVVTGTTDIVNFPEIGLERTAELGVSIISKARLHVYRALVMSAVNSDKPNSPGTTKINRGNIALYKENQEGKFYRDPLAVYVMLGQEVPTDDSGIFVPNDKTKPAVIYHYRKGGMFGAGKGYTFGKRPIDVPEETMEQQWLKDSFRWELVYSGISKNVITLLYREFVNDNARPAFSQELKYDLGEGSVIGYKGARFDVIKATNVELQYKVLKHLE